MRKLQLIACLVQVEPARFSFFIPMTMCALQPVPVAKSLLRFVPVTALLLGSFAL
jgi:hypothetical protein